MPVSLSIGDIVTWSSGSGMVVKVKEHIVHVRRYEKDTELIFPISWLTVVGHQDTLFDQGETPHD